MGFTGANQNIMIYTSLSSYGVQSLYCVRFVGAPKRSGSSFPLPTRVSLYYFTNHLFFQISAFVPGLGDNKDMYNLIQGYKKLSHSLPCFLTKFYSRAAKAI